MKTSELRMGNYVFYNSYNKEIGFVSGIQESLSNDGKIHINRRIDIFYYVSYIKPIPITEDWLIKFGFSDEVDFFTIKDIISFSRGLNKTYVMLDNIIENIKYVHQLQNLYFALTNKELSYEKL